MNDSTTPLTPDVVDELLSAELDGEFATAAEDLGLPENDARERLQATPGVDERRAAMLRARAAVGAAPAVDDLMRQRLVAKALRASEQAGDARRGAAGQRTRRIWIATGSIAAVVLVVLGLALAMNNGSRKNNTASSDRAPEKASSADSGTSAAVTPNAGGNTAAQNDATAVLDFGDVADANVLRQKVLTALGDSAAPRAATRSGVPSTTAPAFATKTPLQSGDAQSSASVPAPCRAVVAGIAPGATPLLDARGTIAGSPVDVVVVRDRDGGRMILVMTPDCKVVNEQFLN